MISNIPGLSRTVGLQRPRFGLGLDIQEDKARVYVSGQDSMDRVELRYAHHGEGVNTVQLVKNPGKAQWELPQGVGISTQKNLDLQLVGIQNGQEVPLPLNTMMKRVFPTSLLPAPKPGQEDGLWLNAFQLKDGKPDWGYRLPLKWNGQQWEVINNFKSYGNDLYYEIIRDKQGRESIVKSVDEMAAFFAETEKHSLLRNEIPAQMKRPGGQGNSLLGLYSSVLDKSQLQALAQTQSHGQYLQSVTGHFPPSHRKLQGRVNPQNDFLKRVVRDAGIRVFEPRPLIGGDGAPVYQAHSPEELFETVSPLGKKPSNHGYWGSNIFQLNGVVPSPKDFEDEVLGHLDAGADFRFDGAFVNEGLNGIHFMQNMLYGRQSPTAGYFSFEGQDAFPNSPLKLGVLPATILADGTEVPDHAKWSLRPVPKLHPSDKTFYQMYNPLLEDEHGKPRDLSHLSAKEQLALWPKTSQESVQDYMIPVDESMVPALNQALRESKPDKRGKAILEVLDQSINQGKGHATLTTSAYDNCSKKWDGQRDVAMLNLQNPEVRQYLVDGCRFWTDKVDRIYSRKVANALTSVAYRGKPTNAKLSAKEWLDSHEKISKTERHDQLAQHVLPMIPGEDRAKITEASIQQAITEYKKQGAAQQLSPAEFMAKQVVSDFPVGSLPATFQMQIHLANPRLADMLKNGDKPAWFVFAESVLGPLAKGLDRLASTFKKDAKPFQTALNWLRPKSFQQHLAQHLQTAFAKLPKTTQEKLKDPLLGHLYYEEMARSIYLSLLTGQFVRPSKANEVPSLKMAKAMAGHIPAAIRNAHPDVSARGLSKFLVDGLKQNKGLNWAEFNKDVETWMAPLDGEATAVTRHILNQRRLGLHWRIDAFKELADMQRVRSVDPDHRTDILREEIGHAKEVLGLIQAGVRDVFPNSQYILEVTDFDWLTMKNDPSINAADYANPYFLKRYLYEGTVADGKVNYRHGYSGLPAGLGGMKACPDEPGDPILSPEGFVREVLREMMEVAPLDRAMNLQNITANHDKSSTIHMLTTHNILGRYDYWFSIEHEDPKKRGKGNNARLDDILETEIQYQAPFVCPTLPLQQREQLAEAFKQAKYKTTFSQDVENSRQAKNPSQSFLSAAIKQQYVKDVMTTVRKEFAKQFSIADLDAFEQGLKTLAAEPSQLKAYRAVLHNAMLNLLEPPAGSDYEALGQDVRTALTTQQKQAFKTQFGQWVWDYTHSVGPEHALWMAHRPLDETIRGILHDVPKTLMPADPEARRKLQLQLEQALYNIATHTARQRFERIAAMQVAMPGDPTFNLPDLLGMTGGEGPKNMFMGNRPPLRFDWIFNDVNPETFNPELANAYQKVTEVSKLRDTHSVLNEGNLELLLDPDRTPDEKNALNNSPVIPLIRSTATDKILCLINRGYSNTWEIWTTYNNCGEGARYPQMRMDTPIAKDYKANFKFVDYPKGTVFVSVDPEGKREAKQGQSLYYGINDEHLLVRLNPDMTMPPKAQQKGIDVSVARFLKFVPDQKAKGV